MRSFSCSDHVALFVDCGDPCRWVTLPKSSDPKRIVSNMAVYDFELDKEDMVDLDSLDRGDDGSVTWHPVNAP